MILLDRNGIEIHEGDRVKYGPDIYSIDKIEPLINQLLLIDYKVEWGKETMKSYWVYPIAIEVIIEDPKEWVSRMPI